MRDPNLTRTTAIPRPQAADAPDEAPLLFDRYRIVETRAQGGFGEVDVCWDTRLQRRVAIKRMPLRAPGAAATPLSTMEDALSEARASSFLTHPNIVTVYDFETDGESAFLVMEYVDGLSLSELLARVEGGVLTYDEGAHVLDSLGSAIEFAHDNGVLHLDIKPANVLIDRTGNVKLGDFGMATLASAAGYGGARGGTVGYMAPEQLSGELVDERSDVFSLAVVTYEMLTGTNPFAAPTAERSLERINKGATPISRAEPELKGMVEDVIAQAFEPNPSFRIASVGDFCDAIVPALGDPDEGFESLADIMRQVSDDEGDSELGSETKAPLAERCPWLFGTIVRIAAAAFFGWTAWRLAPGLGLADSEPRLVITAMVAASGAAFPALGCALTLAELVIAIAMSGVYSMAFTVAVVVGAVSAAWWIACGRRSRLAGLGVIVPAVLGHPTAGAALAAYGLGPSGALATGIIGCLLSSVFSATVGSSFSAGSIYLTCVEAVTKPTTWIVAVGCGLAACAASALERRGSLGLALFGQGVGAALVVFSLAVSGRVENGGIWVAPSWGEALVAVVCFVLMGTVTVLFGPPNTHREDT